MTYDELRGVSFVLGIHAFSLVPPCYEMVLNIKGRELAGQVAEAIQFTLIFLFSHLRDVS